MRVEEPGIITVMLTKTTHPRTLLAMLVSLLVILTSCTTPTQTQVVPSLESPVASTTTPAETLPSSTPASTPIPAAATINGEPIPLIELESELIRYQTVQQSLQNSTPVEEQRKVVLEDLINQILLAQGAAEAGFVVDDSTLENRINQLVTQLGSSEALNSWIRDHLYTEAEFRKSLRRSIAAAFQRDQIMLSVPETAEQVHARQILVFDRVSAEKALSRLVPGLDFATLVDRYDPVTGGDLGWFPRGYLTAKEVEDAAFSLQLGEVSDIIESKIGFHIIEVLERDAQRRLSPDAHLALQKQALQSWLEDRRAVSEIVITNP